MKKLYWITLCLIILEIAALVYLLMTVEYPRVIPIPWAFGPAL